MISHLPDRIQCLSVLANSTLLEAMRGIDEGACGLALVVGDSGRLLGVVTDGDIRRAILAGAALTDRVEEHMQRRFTAVAPDTGRTEVLDLMRARTLSQIPIVDEAGKLVGLHLLREIIGAVKRPNWAVIMAGGRGERLRPLTDSVPKPMIKVAGRPILERIVLHLVGFGIRRIFLAVNYLSGVVEEHFRDGAQLGCRIEYVRESQPLGTGGALSLLTETPADPLLVLNADLLTEFNVGNMLAFHAQGEFAATLGVHNHVQSIPFGVLEIAEGRILGIREKPTMTYPTNAGIYVLNPALLARVPRDTAYTIPALIEDCVARGEPVGAFPIDDEWLDIGRPHELQRARGEASS